MLMHWAKVLSLAARRSAAIRQTDIRILVFIFSGVNAIRYMLCKAGMDIYSCGK